MKKIKIFSLFVCLAMLVIACHNDDDERGVQMRTVLVYIAGDNSLRSFATEDLAEMTEGMQSVDDNSYNLLVYIDTGSSPKLIRLKKDKKKNVVQEELIATYEGRNSVDVSKMKEVINTAFSEYPAQSYGLVLWSHGEGWLAKSQNKTRWWGQDGGSNYMDISELKDVLRNAPHLSFLLFDACFMQSVEVVYELKEHADYIIGSPTEIPAPGAPYQKVVPAMFANNASATDIAKAYFEFYADENLYTGKLPYNWGLGDPWTAGVSVSVVNTSMLEQLAKSSSETSEYEAWKAAYDAAVVYWKTTPNNYSSYGGSFSMNGSAGLSTYIFRQSYEEEINPFYRQSIQWYSAAGWDETGW